MIDVRFLKIDRLQDRTSDRTPRHNFDKLTPQPRPVQGFCRFLDRTPPIANYN
ncbi:hypothetical protein [Microcoleus sp. D2_18a_B4]|uniref:hypothetical protein n=1 Tax=Microcoleus sp. D2_18a_B4 TaxID=3055329 RepID=UPI002FD5DA18